MAELPTTQPVASEPNGAAQPAPAASTSAPALEDLDALLSRYSEDTSTPANQPAPTPTKPAQQPKADEPALMDRVKGDKGFHSIKPSGHDWDLIRDFAAKARQAAIDVVVSRDAASQAKRFAKSA